MVYVVCEAQNPGLGDAMRENHVWVGRLGNDFRPEAHLCEQRLELGGCRGRGETGDREGPE